MPRKPKSFAELGIPFPLFAAPPRDASEYVGRDTCSLCGRKAQHCFVLSIGAAVIVPCARCGTETALDADDRKTGTCKGCGADVSFRLRVTGELHACYACLRAGKASLSKDTELGMVSWEQAVEGLTHGVPGLRRDDFELVPGEEDWMRARVPSDILLELVRTPTYKSIQGDRWQFCCTRPMVFIGVWDRCDFAEQAPDGDGKKLFDEVVQHVVPGLWEDKLHDVTGIYVFRCSRCSRKTAHWDIA